METALSTSDGEEEEGEMCRIFSLFAHSAKAILSFKQSAVVFVHVWGRAQIWEQR
jgi:hypothetical protein